MKNLTLFLAVLLLPAYMCAQSKNSTWGKWIAHEGKPVIDFVEGYEGFDGKQESIVLTVIKNNNRAGIQIWMITGLVGEATSINLQVGDNKVVNIPYKNGQAFLDDGYYINNGEEVDVSAQLLNSKEATIIFDDAGGMAHIIKVPLADFQKAYAKL
jgi:hypothetical protein